MFILQPPVGGPAAAPPPVQRPADPFENFMKQGEDERNKPLNPNPGPRPSGGRDVFYDFVNQPQPGQQQPDDGPSRFGPTIIQGGLAPLAVVTRLTNVGGVIGPIAPLAVPATGTVRPFLFNTANRTLPFLSRIGVATNNFIQAGEAATATLNTARASGTAVTWGTRALSYGGRTARFMTTGVGGRALPALGCAIAVWDCGRDLYNLGTMKKEEGESEQDYQSRLSTTRWDAGINVGCTVAGAAIGFCLGGPVGAMIGAGIGNMVGNLFKSGGVGRSIIRGIGRFFGF